MTHQQLQLPLPPGAGHLAPAPGGPLGTSTLAGHRAAAAVAKRRRRICELLAEAAVPFAGGLTCHEIAEILSREEGKLVHAHQISGRFGSRDGLAADGLIERTGIRRRTPTGAQADVWRITDAGKRRLKEGGAL